MNALELADKLEKKALTADAMEYGFEVDFEEAATMLRQQQAEIESLKAGKIRAYDNGVEDGRKPNTHPVNPYQSITNTKIEPTVVSYTHPVKELTDEEILKMAADKFHYSEYKLVIDFARAILRKAGA